MDDRRIIHLLDDGRGPVRAHLREPAQLPGVEAEADDGVAAAGLGLGYDAGDCVVSGRV